MTLKERTIEVWLVVKNMQNPFTTTFSKIPILSYIQRDEILPILNNFSYDEPSESVYKITGARGSGKTIILAKIEEELAKDKNWCVCRLSVNRDMLNQLLGDLKNKKIIKSKSKTTGINVSATILGSGGGLGFNKENDDNLDPGAELDSCFQNLMNSKTKILIGIDDVSRTTHMIEFASEFSKWLRAGYHVYLVCTGLYENIENLSNVNNLTFFRRATTIQSKFLNNIRMVEMYKKTLNVDVDKAKYLAGLTKGYAYAFQKLGFLYFESKTKNMDEIIAELKTELFSYSYEKIWEELTAEDRALISLLDKDNVDYKRDYLMKEMGDKHANYNVYRDRLLKRGLINNKQGSIALALPFFAEYMLDYCF